MPVDEKALSKLKKLIEVKTGWGDSEDWLNQDFLSLSGKIQDETKVSLSHMTLKRIWGKVKYDSLPNTYTLNTLAQFAGFENWRDFKIKNNHDSAVSGSNTGASTTADQKEFKPLFAGRKKIVKPILIATMAACLVVGILVFSPAAKQKINPDDYTLSVKKVLNTGLPNSVIFDYDASKAPFDSVIIQQSWNTKLRTKVPRDQHQHTLIYYMPGFFQPKLVIGDQIVKEDDLLIRSDGWLTTMEASPMPIYFRKEEVISNGKMALSIDKIKAENISLMPQAPILSYTNVQDFGEIYTNDFVFETSLRNDYRDGSSVCQMTNIYLLCEGTAVCIPLCAKGCESAVNFFFTNQTVSGKQKDLSAFGVSFNDFVKVKIESAGGTAKILFNDKLVYTVNRDIIKSKIIGIDFTFQGTGSVEYVKLFNKNVSFEDTF